MKLPPYDLSGLPITYQAEIPEKYRDLMGHMNVMWYTHLFTCTFPKFAGSFGMDIDYFRKHQAGSFQLEMHTRYLSEVHIGNHVTIRTRALGRTEKRIHFIHFMTIDETGALACTQEHIGAHIDMKVRRMSPLPDFIAERFDALVAEHNNLGWDAPVCGAMKP